MTTDEEAVKERVPLSTSIREEEFSETGLAAYGVLGN
jgi:hypothetical protein